MSSPALAASRASVADFLELTKPRITLLVVFTGLVGFVMASPGPVSGAALTPALLGIALVAAGASALNMLLERDTDALMQRTRSRPLPAGRLRPAEALLFGLVLSGLGLGTLAWLSGGVGAAVALATWASYLFLYTPLKRR
ncbi:MAG TPA: UbiA family prenyltransferase, partial [Vicinamibacteria bacterium]|nr:UbiA family prenyltransferase [Vicinamibacteria bacterium]